jgi:hypothetical protein
MRRYILLHERGAGVLVREKKLLQLSFAPLSCTTSRSTTKTEQWSLHSPLILGASLETAIRCNHRSVLYRYGMSTRRPLKSRRRAFEHFLIVVSMFETST